MLLICKSYPPIPYRLRILARVSYFLLHHLHIDFDTLWNFRTRLYFDFCCWAITYIDFKMFKFIFKLPLTCNIILVLGVQHSDEKFVSDFGNFNKLFILSA
ncbi:unnamed protein product [Pipistrellus nathusii]|uniref:Uncharacterized protein n=1 Tax=Pipistrellus nathusii TaxID=59473 RepID=A0ABN9ZUI2_PIPNA